MEILNSQDKNDNRQNNKSLNPLCYRLVLLMMLGRRGRDKEVLCLHGTKRAQLIQMSCLPAGTAVNGPGAQVNHCQGGTGEDGTG